MNGLPAILTAADAYRAYAKTMFRINEAHDLRTTPVAHNDNGGGV